MADIASFDSSISNKTVGANLKCSMWLPLDKTRYWGQNFTWANGTRSQFRFSMDYLGYATDTGVLILNVSGASMSTLSIFAVLASLLVL
jgi:hypothetical protein